MSELNVIPTTPVTPAAPAAVVDDLRGTAMDADVMAARVGRIVFGVVLLLTLQAIAVLYIVAGPLDHRGGVHVWHLLVGGWVVGFGARLLARIVAFRVLARGTRRAGDRLLWASLVVPMVGLSFLMPLSLHMPFALLGGDGRTFDAWVAASALITGHAHVALAILCTRRATALVDGLPARSPVSIAFLTVAVSAFPSILLYGIPPILVAITGIPMLPVIEHMETIVRQERARLA
jgi:hypothetical protein